METNLKVFTPASIGPLKLRNRTIRSAAFEGMCPGGVPSQALIDYHHSLAAGGIGMTTVAYASVTRDGLTFPHQMWMRPEIIVQLRKLTDAVHREGAAASVQLGHAGYMADQRVIGQKPFAPSAVFNLFGLVTPRAMNESQIMQMAQAFAQATKLAQESGFDAVEIQAGHGYLISQFLSPHTNRRTDDWGGILENRARFLRLVMDAVKKVTRDKVAVVVKTNIQDGFAAGMPAHEAIEVARMLEAAGADALVLSGGFVSKCPMYLMRGEIPMKELLAYQDRWVNKVGLALFGRMMVKAYPFTEAFFLEDAMCIRQAVKTPLALVGGIKSLDKIEEVLERGFDFVAMARALFIEPDFVAQLQQGKTRVSRCEPCNKCMATMYTSEAVCLPEVERLKKVAESVK